MYQKFIDACKAGNLREVQKLYDECSETKRQKMLTAKNFLGYDCAAFLYAARNGHLEVVKFLWEKCSEDERQEMLASNNYEAFLYAAENGHLEVVKFLWGNCPQDKRQEMLASNGYAAFRYAAKNRHVHVLDWLLSVADENMRTEIYSELLDTKFALKLVSQRKEIKKNAPVLDIDKFNSQFTHFCKNRTLARMLLTCKNLPEGLGNSLQIMKIFAETANFVAGRNYFDLQISEPTKTAQEILQCKSGNAVNTKEFFLAARKLKFDLSDSALYSQSSIKKS